MPHTDIKDILAPILSNALLYGMVKKVFVFPTNLHCSQTRMAYRYRFILFVSPTNLHCSQTKCSLPSSAVTVCFPYEFTLLSNRIAIGIISEKFVSPTNLHCSQTGFLVNNRFSSLFPLRIYTALKPRPLHETMSAGLFPLRIYTALKQKG